MGLLQPTFFVLSAPSGSGKTSLVKRALECLPFLTLSASTTTRPPRLGEAEGVDYHFTTKDEFLHSIDSGDFLEWAEVYGHYYGTSKLRLEQVRSKGFCVLLDIDVQGAMQLKQLPGFNAHYLFIRPPSLEALRARLVGRGTESASSLKKRIGNAAHELTFQEQYDHVILNDDLEQATGEFIQLLIQLSIDLALFRGMMIKDVMASLFVREPNPWLQGIIKRLKLQVVD